MSTPTVSTPSSPAGTPAAGARPRRGALAPSVAIGLPAVTGLLSGLWIPRGPVVTVEALVLLVGGVAVGIAAGHAARSRWVVLVAPLAHVLAFELARVGADGPSVDGLHLNVLGVLAFLAGRGFHALIVVLPMAVGAAYGVRLGRGQRRPGAATTVGFLVVLGVTVLLVRPATTPPILDRVGQPVAGSIATLESVEIGGRDHWISIRGHDTDAPVLLFLTGGPGGSHLGWNRPFFRDLEQDMVVVQWDQRGTGKSYAGLEPTETLTVDAVVADTIALTEHLRERFDEDRIYLLGNSWGTTLGVLTVERRPELYHAYIGAGQMVSQRETDTLLYEEMVAWADEHDADLAQRLRAQGPPPYADVAAYEPLLVSDWQRVYPFAEPPDAAARSAETGMLGIGAVEYDLVDKVNVVRGLVDTFAVLYPQLQDLDLRRDVAELEVPVYLVQGRFEMPPRAALVPEWFDQLEAPSKRLDVFDRSGHNPYNSEFARFRELVVDTVLPETYPAP
jgi:proline iminopeptidase